VTDSVFEDQSRQHPGTLLGAERAPLTLQEQVAQCFEEAREDVYRYLLTLGLYPQQAQEATQEVFLRLYIALKKGEQDESARLQNWRAWVFRVAHNQGLKVRVRENVQPPFDPAFELRLTDPAPGPERDLIDRERISRVHRAIQGLSEQQRRCLFLRMEGLRYPEIGEILGISASTVGEFLRRAMVRLRKANDE
jgi:RNA polymerase sigma-70 factor (ECF subfamily)